HGDLPAGTDDDDLARPDLGWRDDDLVAVAADGSRLGRQLEEAGEGVTGATHGGALERPAEGEQERDRRALPELPDGEGAQDGDRDERFNANPGDAQVVPGPQGDGPAGHDGGGDEPHVEGRGGPGAERERERDER